MRPTPWAGALLSLVAFALGLGLWAASAICFGLLMALGLRMLFGINYSKGLLLVAVAALVFAMVVVGGQSLALGASARRRRPPFSGPPTACRTT